MEAEVERRLKMLQKMVKAASRAVSETERYVEATVNCHEDSFGEFAAEIADSNRSLQALTRRVDKLSRSLERLEDRVTKLEQRCQD